MEKAINLTLNFQAKVRECESVSEGKGNVIALLTRIRSRPSNAVGAALKPPLRSRAAATGPAGAATVVAPLAANGVAEKESPPPPPPPPPLPPRPGYADAGLAGLPSTALSQSTKWPPRVSAGVASAC